MPNPPSPAPIPTIESWRSHIHSLIEPSLDRFPLHEDHQARAEFVATFRDEFGNRRESDGPFLATLLAVDPQPLPESHTGLDARLWQHIASGTHPESIPELQDLPPNDGLLDPNNNLAIEYRTMVELCALHALWTLAKRSQSDTLMDRTADAARWHIAEIQPDNAINRPWGIPVFIDLSVSTDDQQTSRDASLHAQTLIHNACVQFGRPDNLSALILLDTLRWLELQEPDGVVFG